MTANDVPEEVKRLLRDHISSVEQLEVLLLLRNRRSEVFDAKAISEELRTSETSVGTRLADLEKHGLVSSQQEDARHVYRYAPKDESLGRAVDLLDHAYGERRYRVIELIFSKPIDNLRVYAGAFRFRKDESDG